MPFLIIIKHNLAKSAPFVQLSHTIKLNQDTTSWELHGERERVIKIPQYNYCMYQHLIYILWWQLDC